MAEVDQYQGMSKAVMARLLARVAAYDRRFVPGEADVEAFTDVAAEWRWTAHEVETQIRKWGGTRRPEEGMEPAMLNRLIRDARQDSSMRNAAAPRPGVAGGYSASPEMWMEAWQHRAAVGRKVNQQIRDAVGQYPDLVERLEARPMPVKFESWTGWYPSDTTAFGGPNDSPRAAKIRGIAEEALVRSGLRAQWRQEQRDATAADLAAFKAEGEAS